MNNNNIPLFPMGSLYVGDLHPDVTEAMIYEKFSGAGQVLSLRLCRDVRTRQSLGYGYVNFSNSLDAERALDTMNFDLLKNKPIRIMWCQRDPGLRKSGIGNIFIKNLDKSIDNKSMYDTFSAFGHILSCKVALDDEGKSKGYGFVHFETEELALKAIEKVNGMLLNGKVVYVGKFVPRIVREKELGERARPFTNLFVKNFGQNMSDQKFKDLFAKFGPITSSLVVRDVDGTSKGFGFVAFEDAKSAENAAQEMNGTEFENRTIYVGPAQKKSERMQELRRKFEQQRMERFARYQGVNLYIKNLDDSFDDEKLKTEFEAYGTITSAKVMTSSNGRSRGFGFVCYTNTDDATKAIQEMNAKIVGSKPLYVALAQRKETRRALLANQHMIRAHAARQQGVQYAGAPSFLLPAVAQGPRIFTSAPPLRPAPRWPGLQTLARPNGATFGLPLLGATPFRTNSTARPLPQQRSNSRPITSTSAGPLTARPNSKFTQRHGLDAPVIDGRYAQVAPQETKQILGEQLFKIVEKLHPDLAGKITGMLLEIDNSELVHMIKDQESLRARVEEAIAVLEAHKQLSSNKKVLTIQD